MGTQTQGENGQQQRGNDKKTPAPNQQPPHDPIVDPDRDNATRAERLADKNRRKGAEAGDAGDSTDRPGKDKVVNEDEDDDEDDKDEKERAEVGKR